MQMMYEETSQVASNVIGNIRTVASFSAEEKVIELYKKKSEGPVTTGIRQGLISGIGFGISFFLLYCVYATSFYAGARLIQDGKTTFEKVFRVCITLTFYFSMPFSISILNHCIQHIFNIKIIKIEGEVIKRRMDNPILCKRKGEF